MTRKAFLHVGTPKSGTTYLQQVVWRQRRLLADHGLLLPGRPTTQLEAARKLRSRRGAVPQPWLELVRLAGEWEGDVLVSREALASCPPRRAAAGARAFTEAGIEVHVVITARDLGRQWPASWQEQVKSGRRLRFERYVEHLRASVDRRRVAWAHVDAAEVVRLWGEALGGAYDRVHLITVPQPGAPADELWRRFAATVGVPAEPFDPVVPKTNTSLGVEQIEVVRRVNIALAGRIRRPLPFARVVKGRLAQHTLGGRPGTPLRLGGEDLAFARERAGLMIERLRTLRDERGLHVVGALAELDVADTGLAESTLRVAPDDAALLGEVVAGLAGMLVRQHARTPAAVAAPPAASAAVGRSSLGAAQTTLVERVRAEIGDRLGSAEVASGVVADLLVDQVLAGRKGPSGAGPGEVLEEGIGALADLLVVLSRNGTAPGGAP